MFNIMYTKIDDWLHAKKINDYLISNPNATKKDVGKSCITNWHRIKYLEQSGLIKLKART